MSAIEANKNSYGLRNKVAIVALMAFFTACGNNLAQGINPKNESATTTSVVPALQSHNPKVVVTPSSGLANGEKVKVTVTGFGKGGKFFLSECASKADVSSGGCGSQMAAQPMGVTDNSGGGTLVFTVTSSAAVAPPVSHQTQSCTDQCVLVATEGVHFGYAYAPLTFVGG